MVSIQNIFLSAGAAAPTENTFTVIALPLIVKLPVIFTLPFIVPPVAPLTVGVTQPTFLELSNIASTSPTLAELAPGNTLSGTLIQ